MISFKSRASITILAFSLLAATVSSQTNDKSSRNNPFAPSPRVDKSIRPTEKQTTRISINAGVDKYRMVSESVSARSDINTQVRSENNVLPGGSEHDPTRVFSVGIGDILSITIQNSAASSGQYIVRNDGTIDFPLAGENVIVAGRTIDKIRESIAESVKLYQVPQVNVAVREYSSHAVLIKGMVNVPGYHQLHRDAVPLYVIRAAVEVNTGAKGVKIDRKSDSNVESYLLANNKVDGILVFPGDTVEFTGTNDEADPAYYAISGNVANSGRRELTEGTRLSQAIASNGGVRGNPKRVIIHRRDENGNQTSLEYQFKSLIAGKNSDPIVHFGDIIEVLR